MKKNPPYSAPADATRTRSFRDMADVPEGRMMKTSYSMPERSMRKTVRSMSEEGAQEAMSMRKTTEPRRDAVPQREKIRTRLLRDIADNKK